MTAQHTPWTRGELLTASENSRGFTIRDSRGVGIARVFPLDRDGEAGGAVSEFIVRAVNSHALMLEALRDIVARYGDDVEPHIIARNAIRAATGEDDSCSLCGHQSVGGKFHAPNCERLPESVRWSTGEDA